MWNIVYSVVFQINVIGKCNLTDTINSCGDSICYICSDAREQLFITTIIGILDCCQNISCVQNSAYRDLLKKSQNL